MKKLIVSIFGISFGLLLMSASGGIYNSELLVDPSFEFWDMDLNGVERPEWVYYWNVNADTHSVGTEDAAYVGARSLQITSEFANNTWSEDGFSLNDMRNLTNVGRSYQAGDVVLLSLWVKANAWDAGGTLSNPGLGIRLRLEPSGGSVFVAAVSDFVADTAGEWQQVKTHYTFTEAFTGTLGYELRFRHSDPENIDNIAYVDGASLTVAYELPEDYYPEEPGPEPPDANELLMDGSFEEWDANNPAWVYYWNVNADKHSIGTTNQAHEAAKSVQITSEFGNNTWEEDGFTLNDNRNSINRNISFEAGERVQMSLWVNVSDWDVDSTISNPGIGFRLRMEPDGGGIQVGVVSDFVNDTGGLWQEITAEYVFAEAFSGTLSYEVRFRHSDPENKNDIAYVDSASMKRVEASVPGEPTTVNVAAFSGFAEGQPSLSFTGEAGVSYQLEYTANLAAAPVVWQAADGDDAAQAGIDGTVILKDANPEGDNARFYRVVGNSIGL